LLDKNRNTGLSSRHLLRLQKFCMNSGFRTLRCPITKNAHSWIISCAVIRDIFLVIGHHS
jgi:hypothetical protein